MIGIYKITSPTNKIYIGQSVDIERRLRKYKYKNSAKYQTILKNSFNSHGVDNHIFEVIEECDISKLNKRERYWQEHYDTLNNGLNCRYTETTDKSGRLSQETKNKISKANKGNTSWLKGKIGVVTRSKETREKLSKINKGKYMGKDNPFYGKTHTEETKKIIREKRKLQKFTKETRKKLSEARLGTKLSQETKDKISKANKGKSKPRSMKVKFGEPVLQYDLDGNLLREFISLQEAADHVGVNKTAIYQNVKGKSKTSAGFIWKYKKNVK